MSFLKPIITEPRMGFAPEGEIEGHSSFPVRENNRPVPQGAMQGRSVIDVSPLLREIKDRVHCYNQMRLLGFLSLAPLQFLIFAFIIPLPVLIIVGVVFCVFLAISLIYHLMYRKYQRAENCLKNAEFIKFVQKENLSLDKENIFKICELYEKSKALNDGLNSYRNTTLE